MEKDILYELGLGKNEVEVYIALLKLGSSAASQIGKLASIHRPNIYDSLNKLIKKGLVTYFVQNEKKYYEAADPEQLMNLLTSKELELKKLIPQLKTLQIGAKPRSNIAVFEGIVGVRKVQMDLIENTKELYILGVPRDLPRVIGESWVYNWHMERIKRKVMFYHLVNEDYYLHRIKLLRKMKYVGLKFLPKEYNAPNATFINDNFVAFFFIKPLMAIKLENKEVVKSFKNYFKMLMRIAKNKAPQETK